jgi:DNA mismatch repair protein MutS
MPLATCAAGAVVQYLRENQKAALGHVGALSTYNPTRFMLLDAQTRRNLELVTGSRDADKRNSLLGVLDLTRTALGARLLRRWLGQPLLDVTVFRQDGSLVPQHIRPNAAVKRWRRCRTPNGC